MSKCPETAQISSRMIGGTISSYRFYSLNFNTVKASMTWATS